MVWIKSQNPIKICHNFTKPSKEIIWNVTKKYLAYKYHIAGSKTTKNPTFIALISQCLYFLVRTATSTRTYCSSMQQPGVQSGVTFLALWGYVIFVQIPRDVPTIFSRPLHRTHTEKGLRFWWLSWPVLIRWSVVRSHVFARWLDEVETNKRRQSRTKNSVTF